MIRGLTGDDFGVYKDDKHALFEWTDGPHRVVFSATQYGGAISCHFAADKKSLKKVKTACKEWVQWVFDTCQSCIMIIAAVSNENTGVKRLVSKLGFVEFARDDSGQILYMRRKDD